MERLKRSFVIPENIDKALGYTAVEHSIERSVLVADALKFYLPTITKNPLVLDAVNLRAIAPQPSGRKPAAVMG